jgi:hypothetical protein
MMPSRGALHGLVACAWATMFAGGGIAQAQTPSPTPPAARAKESLEGAPAAHQLDALPAWLRARIEAPRTVGADAGSDQVAPDAVFVLEHEGRPYFLLAPPCCDAFEPMYDAVGTFVCHPSGGIAGGGDGKCPEFRADLVKKRLLWEAPAPAAKPADAASGH